MNRITSVAAVFTIGCVAGACFLAVLSTQAFILVPAFGLVSVAGAFGE